MAFLVVLHCNTNTFMGTLSFSIVTISFNHAEFIERTIQSVLDQNYPNFEHIIVDGGSTDKTVEILKKYPHLKWTSEPDKGVSNALNKGFKRATGDIIGWLNSDDYYAPNIFSTIAENLRLSDIVLGNAFEADRAGNPTQEMINHPRTLYDLEKYWIPKAWLVQPSVFFTKKALLEVALENGDFIDESFKYSMDCDLWLRLAKKFSFTNHISKTFSYYRVYGENLTGTTFASPQRELGRAFRKSVAARTLSERPHSYVIPVFEVNEKLGATIQSLFDQKLHHFDIIFVDCVKNPQHKSLLLQTIRNLEETTTLITIYHVKYDTVHFHEALKAGIESSTSDIITTLRCGDVIPTEHSYHTLNTFAHDVYGANFHLPIEHQIAKKLTDGNNQGLIAANSFLGLDIDFIPFSVRRAALQEIGGYPWDEAGHLSMHLLMMRINVKGWLLMLEGRTPFEPVEINKWHPNHEALSNYAKALLFCLTQKVTQNDIFYRIRSETSYSPLFPQDAVIHANNFLLTAPNGWQFS